MSRPRIYSNLFTSLYCVSGFLPVIGIQLRGRRGSRGGGPLSLAFASVTSTGCVPWGTWSSLGKNKGTMSPNMLNWTHLFHSITIGLAKVCLIFFGKIKDTFFIFTNSITDLGIWSMVVLSCKGEHWWFSLNVSIGSLSTSAALPDLGVLSSEESPARNFANHFWHTPSVTAPSPHTARIFYCISVAFLPFLK